MLVKQLYTKCLSQGAYYIESNGEAAVIDPLREVSEYINLSNLSNSKIKYIFETHFHADFISGHLTLSKKTNAPIVYGPNANPSFECIIAKDNQEFKIGDITIKVIHTPGHTLESTCYLLIDSVNNPYCLFTGDTLFLGDVGRPDLAQKSMNISKEELAGILFDSVNNKLSNLPDHVLVYPAHGAGSACGKNMMKETVDTLGNQKKINYALNGSLSKEDFIKELTYDLESPPEYFPSNVKLNQEGYLDFSSVLKQSLNPLSFIEFKNLINDNTVILDVRNQNEFKKGFIPGSIFIGLNGAFAPWVGSIIKDISTKLLLVCDEGQEQEAIMRLSRVGFDNCLGYLAGGFSTWLNNDCKYETIETIDSDSLSKIIDDINLIDVRKLSERDNGYLSASKSIPLDDFENELSEINSDEKNYIHCAGGYRSVIACSILKRNDYDSVVDVAGGFSSIRKSNFEIIVNE
jgi:glyoxylase-like metal-dependent hydrolase (beta-lactamase superfamily II)/rhodanese-related sulfurtransferase